MLTKRQEKVLRHIIEWYSKTKTPLGSNSLAEYPDIKASSATIRNEMAKLEKAKLIEKRHLSSGRVPTEEGYRYYVHHIIPQLGGVLDDGLSKENHDLIEKMFNRQFIPFDDIMEQSATLLADLTQAIALALGPSLFDYHYSSFQVLSVSSYLYVGALLTEEGEVKTRTFLSNEELRKDHIDEELKFWNEKLKGLSLLDVMETIQKTEALSSPVMKRLFSSNGLLEVLIQDFDSSRLYIRGRDYLLDYYSRRKKWQSIQLLTQLLEQSDRWVELLNQASNNFDVQLGIGNLPEEEELNLSLMTAPFAPLSGRGPIIFAILGPEDMEYLHVAQLFQGVRVEFGRYMQNYHQPKGGET